jgi:hypothetical protein
VVPLAGQRGGASSARPGVERQRLVRARSISWSPRPLITAFTMYMRQPLRHLDVDRGRHGELGTVHDRIDQATRSIARTRRTSRRLSNRQPSTQTIAVDSGPRRSPPSVLPVVVTGQSVALAVDAPPVRRCGKLSLKKVEARSSKKAGPARNVLVARNPCDSQRRVFAQRFSASLAAERRGMDSGAFPP